MGSFLGSVIDNIIGILELGSSTPELLMQVAHRPFFKTLPYLSLPKQNSYWVASCVCCENMGLMLKLE